MSRVRRSSSCSSTCPPTGSTARSRPPSSSPSSTSTCARRSAPPASTPATTSRRPRRDVSPARPASCPPFSTAPRSPSTSAAPDASSPRPSAWRWRRPTTSARRRAATGPTPGATCTTRIRGARGGATDLALAVPLCGFHHRLAHDPRHEHEVHTGADGRKAVTFRAALGRRTRRRCETGGHADRTRGAVRAGASVGGTGDCPRRERELRCAGGAQASALPRRTRRWPRRTSPGTTAGPESTGSGAGVRGRPASRTASARASRSSVLGCGSG